MPIKIRIGVLAAAIGAASFTFSVTLSVSAASAGQASGQAAVQIAQAAVKPAPSAPANSKVAKGAENAVGAVPNLPGEIAGVWLTDDGLGAIEILPCGEKRCGRIVWMKNPMDAKGRPQADVNNPNVALRSRPVCGSEIITGLARQKDQSWDIGKIYDPKDGDDHDLAAKLKSPNELEITGYEGTKWLSETYLWKRAPAELARCDQMQAGMAH